ncbi:MAG TPA: DUF885 domain-containing protein [Actinomycetales bacterium]
MTEQPTEQSTARQPPRGRTEVDVLADGYLDAAIALDPIGATFMGVPGHEHLLTDFSPEADAERADLARRTLAQLAAATPADDVDRVTVAAMRERLGLDVELFEAGASTGALNNLSSPAQGLRDVFDLMATDSVADWEPVAARLAAMPEAVDRYVAALRARAGSSDPAPVRQLRLAAEQCADLASPDSFFTALAAGAPDAVPDLPASLRADLDRGAAAAVSAYQRLHEVLTAELLPGAPDRDPVGADRYALFSRYLLGAEVDLAETYAWGQDEVARIAEEMARTADQVSPGADVAEAVRLLDADPERTLHGTKALQEWMQSRSDESLHALTGTHFDIPEPIRVLECRIAPTTSGGIYYTGPSEDFSRPGRMWWSVPKGEDTFHTWGELSTVYHEGVPGHHLQVAQTVYRAELLNRWRRLGCWVSGHGEGWALYAERLMADLGFLDDPGDRLGMLMSQSMRAARVVIDIGIHCELPAPAEVGGGAWTYESAGRYFEAHTSLSEATRRFELERYLGWPGQAPSYKVGERLWMSLREEVRRREGDAFSLPAFHRKALDLGSVGLDVLQDALAPAAGR